MTTCDQLHTGVMRALMRDIHDLAIAYDRRINDHLYQTTLAQSSKARRDHQRRARQTQAELRHFLAALATIGKQHHDRIIT